jgi:penicillin-binding protein 2
MEHRVDFPGVQADVETIRAYPSPYGVNAAHVLGYLGPVNDAELKAQALRLILPEAKLQRTDLVGRAGLEYQYDTLLRGFPGDGRDAGRLPRNEHRRATSGGR